LTYLIVFREPSGNDYKTRATFRDDAIAPLAFPNIEIVVSTLFT